MARNIEDEITNDGHSINSSKLAKTLEELFMEIKKLDEKIDRVRANSYNSKLPEV